MGGLVLLVVAAGLAGAQPMAMEYVGDLGHLGAGQTLRIGAAEARADGKGRARVTGKGWFVDLAVANGAGWSEVFQADFDGNGQRDFLIANHRPTLSATCGGAVRRAIAAKPCRSVLIDFLSMSDLDKVRYSGDAQTRP